MNAKGDCSDSERGARTRLPPPQQFCPGPPDTQRHPVLLCTILLRAETSRFHFLHICICSTEKLCSSFPTGTSQAAPEATRSRAQPQQKVGWGCLTTGFLPGPSILCKSKVWSDWHHWGPLPQKLLVFYIYLTVNYPVLLSFCQTTGRKHFAGAKTTPNMRRG